MLTYDEIEAFRDEPTERHATRGAAPEAVARALPTGFELYTMTARMHASFVRGMLSGRV